MAKEELVLTVASSGFGKRTSAYEYRVTGRGGMLGVAVDVYHTWWDPTPSARMLLRQLTRLLKALLRKARVI